LEKLVCTLNTQATKSNRKNSRDRSQPSYPIPSLLIEKESSKAKQKPWLKIAERFISGFPETPEKFTKQSKDGKLLSAEQTLQAFELLTRRSIKLPALKPRSPELGDLAIVEDHSILARPS
jgi:hypothetical protein